MTDTNPEKAARVSDTLVAPGDILGGKYRIDGQLGAGGMGVVLSATHLELEAPVAIKVMREEFARNEEIVGRMLFEARAVAKLKSSHVVRVLDVARLDSGAPYIVMERLEGRDLAAVLSERGPLPVEEAVDYVLEACQCLVEAHALGIVHRDLKPENLFRAATREGNVIKVLDFGISKDTGLSPGLSPRSVMTSAGYVIGSPYYMSPEQMRASEVDARADIWSLGAILYELLSGQCPFLGESLAVVCAGVLSDAEAAPLSSKSPRVPEALSAIVACCLRKNREARFEHVIDLATELTPFASAEGQRVVDRQSRFAAYGFDRPSKLESDRLTATPAPVAGTMALALTVQRRAPRRKLIPIAAGLATLAVVALGWAALRDKDGAPSGVQPGSAAAPVEVTPPAPTLAPAPLAEPAVSTAVTAVDSAAKPARSAKRHGAVAVPAVVAAAPPPPSVAAPKPATPPAAPAAKPPGDAWDPDRLGGRY